MNSKEKNNKPKSASDEDKNYSGSFKKDVPKSVWILIAVFILFFLSKSLSLNHTLFFSFFGFTLTGILAWVLNFSLVIFLGFIIYSFFFYRNTLSFSLIVGFLSYETINQFYNLLKLWNLGVLSFGINFYMVFYFLFLITLIFGTVIFRGFFIDDVKGAKFAFYDKLFFYLEILLMVLIIVFVFVDIMNQYNYVSFASAKINQSEINESIRFCNSSDNIFYKELCYGIMITNKFSDKNYSLEDLMTICDSVGNSKFIALNKTLCIIQLANLRNSKSVCDNILYTDYKSYCYATSTKNSSLCLSIDDERIKNACYLQTAG